MGNLRYVVELALGLQAGHVEEGLQALELRVQRQLVELLHHAPVAVLRARKACQQHANRSVTGTHRA